MALVVDSALHYFLPTNGSPFIYCAVPFYVPRPWRHIVLRFGSQVCFEGYLYAHELYKELLTEVGMLIVRLTVGLQLPPLTYYFVIKPWPCLENKSLNGSSLKKNALS